MWFSIDFNSHTPVYQQIKDKIKENIITENIKEDEYLPSIRNLAKDLEVNLNTVSRAYRELVTEEVLKVERGRGYKPNNVDEDLFFKEKIENFKNSVEKCKSSGIKKSKLSSILEKIYGSEEK
ncbi:GntR family transcriptional regulator [Geotoga petraea]|uniref:GntR family transcriptional regulator n=1 Tax=Geotoga petraea TaxID=28234 RepID=A0A4Z0W0V5_9BACT|nr:GntR family transcriptional regulator [Geotoga petraea]TGG88703.1 GntR family transcriptional regulator [Geotoga petraea]